MKISNEQDTSQLFSAIFDAIPQGNILISADNKVRLINTKAKLLLEKIGFTDIVDYKLITELLPDSKFGEFKTLLSLVRKGVSSTKKVYKIKHYNHHYFYEINLVPLCYKAKDENEFINLTINDVSDYFHKKIELSNKDEIISSLLASNTSLLMRIDLEGKYTYVNESFCKKFGASIDAFIGKHFETIVHPDDLILCKDCVGKLIEGQEIVITKLRKSNPNGGYFDTEWELILIKSIENEILEIQALGRDITLQKQAQKEHLFEKQRLENIIIGANVGTWDWDITHNIIKIDHHWASIIGYEMDELLPFTAEKWFALFHPNDLEIGKSVVVKHLEGETEYFECEVRLKHKNGNYIWVQDRGKIIHRSECGAPVWMSGIIKDISIRKETEQNLSIEREKYQNIVNSSEGIVWELDFETSRFTFVSKQAERILGYKVEEWYEPNFWVEHVYEGDKDEAIQFCLSKSATLENHNFEFRFYKKNGSIVWLRDYVTVIAKDNKPNQLRGLLIDITENKNIQKEKELQLNNYQNSGEHLPGFIYQFKINPNGKTSFPFATKGVKRLMGVDFEDLKKDSNVAFSNIHSEDLDGLNKSIEVAYTSLTDWKYEWRTIINNETIWLEGKSTPVKFPDGAVVFYGQVFDITERKQFEDEIFNLSMVAQNTKNAVIITDEFANITWVNQGFTRITGYDFEEAIGKNPGKLLQSEYTNPDTIQYVRDQINKCEPANFEILNKGKNGDIYWLEIEIQPMFKSGKHIGFMAIETDITQRVQTENERSTLLNDLTVKNQELLQFSYIVSHNLRGPVATILGLIYLSKKVKDIDHLGILEMVEKTTLDLDTVIKDLNEILALGKPSEATKLIAFNDIFISAKSLLQDKIFENEPTFEINFEDLTHISTIKGHIQSIFYNLISNSIKYKMTNKKPRIKIQTKKDSQNAIIEFSDNGIGIDLIKNKDKLFGLYQRFSVQAEGKGIGLYLVKKNIESLGGDISVESELGKGVKFIIKLPLENQLW